MSEQSSGGRGGEIRRRRIALGIRSYTELARRVPIDRGTMKKIEDDDPAVSDASYLRVEALLNRLEEEMGASDPGPATVTIRLPSGASVTFTGDADMAAETASRFLRKHGL